METHRGASKAHADLSEEQDKMRAATEEVEAVLMRLQLMANVLHGHQVRVREMAGVAGAALALFEH